MAAALAYRTLFGLIPVMAISLIIFGALLNDNQLRTGVQQALEFFQLDQIVVDPQRVELGTLPEWQMGPPAPMPDAGGAERLDQLVADLVQRVGESIENIPNTGIAIFSLMLLTYAAISMLVEIERAFNQIYHAPFGRKWIKRFFLYWTALTLGSGLIVATFYVGELMKAYAISLAGSTGFLAAVAGFFVTVAITTLLFFTSYTTMPNARVRWRSALAGAAVAAIIWELGKWGFGSYIQYSVGYARFYGSLALLPLFLLWVYVTWVIVLFGLQVAYTLQTFKQWEDDEEDDQPRLIDPAATLAIAASVAARFQRGELATRASVAEGCGLTDEVAASILEALEQRGLLHLVERNNKEGYTLSTTPDRMTATSVIEAASALVRDARGEDRPEVLDRLVAARVSTLENLTLADLIAKADVTPTDTESAPDGATPDDATT